MGVPTWVERFAMGCVLVTALSVSLTLFDPCVRTMFVSETCYFQAMRRVRSITFSTQGAGQVSDVDHSSWQLQLLPPFGVPCRLVLDFAAVDENVVLAHAQVLAYRLG